VPRRPSTDLLRLPARLRAAVARTAQVLDEVGADVVVGFGGYVSAPAYLAARRRRVPVVVHEANARPGLANRLGVRVAAAVVTANPMVPLRRGQPLGIPLRREISRLDRASMRTEARTTLGLETDRPTLLVFGGSQGARRLNTAAFGAAADLTAAGIQVLHAAGRQRVADLPAPASTTSGPAYLVVDYLDQMHLAYAAADLALCRAGALSVAELSAVGLPAVYVPLPIGNGEQRLNAAPVVSAGGGVLVEDEHLSADWLRSTLIPLLQAPRQLAKMAQAAAATGHRDADDRLAELILGIARERAVAT
jgi:UDP-N-acetylglucosamine--N-acetylmuramyl-(pentapeptide) pyrophosphoryl-undecaprenol N-acetylglucosamine transferase